MIAADTSSLVALLRGDVGQDVDRLVVALTAGELVLPPTVITEILTDDHSATLLEGAIPEIQTLEIQEGFWVRAGHARRKLRQRGFKAKLGDALIAQSCIDHDVALVTRDRDFRHFVKHCGLLLA